MALAFLLLLQAQAAEPVLDVATVNAWGLPPPLAPARADRLPRLQGWMTAQGFDLVGLQEVWRGARGLLAGLQLPGHRGDSGLGLHTRHPVLAPLQLSPYASALGVDSWKDKGVLDTVVDLPHLGPTCVLVTHLQAGRGERFAQVRARQVAQLLAQLEGCEGPAVVLGDFNFEDGEGSDRTCQERLARAGLIDVSAGGATYPNGQRYDRIYIRGTAQVGFAAAQAEVLSWGSESLSDHLPLRARLTIER